MGNVRNFFMGFLKGLRRFSHLVADIMNFAFLSVLYFIGIGIVSVVSRLLGKRYMDFGASGSSWLLRKKTKMKIDEYLRMF